MQKIKILGILSIAAVLGLSALIYSQNASGAAVDPSPPKSNAPFKPHHTTGSGTHVTGSPDPCGRDHGHDGGDGAPSSQGDIETHTHGEPGHMFYQDNDNDNKHDDREAIKCYPPHQRRQ